MKKEKQWIDDKVNVNQLSLDLQNPRVPKHVKDHKDVVQVRNYLLENEDVLKIARNIANNGYHRSAVAIAYKEQDELIVLDGNRRLAACQFLLNPKIAPNARDLRKLESLNKIFDKKQFESIKITIAPSRKAAEKEIWDIHVRSLLKPWEVIQKLRMYQAEIDSGDHDIDSASSEYGITPSDFKRELGKLYFHEKLLGQVNKNREKELLKSGFNKIDRLILSTNGKKLLNYKTDDQGNIIIKNQKIFDDNLKKLIPYIVVPEKVRAQATQDELIIGVYSKIDPANFPIKKAAEETNVEPKKETMEKPVEPRKAKPGTKVKTDWITASEFGEYKGAERVKQMLEEMYKLKLPGSNKNILTVSLRVLLELALYHKLEDKGYIAKMINDYKADLKSKNKERALKGRAIAQIRKNWSPSFREMLNYIIDDSKNVINDPHNRDALKKVVKDEVNFVEDLNRFVHNVRYIPAEGDPEKIWSQFGRLLFGIISKIK